MSQTAIRKMEGLFCCLLIFLPVSQWWNHQALNSINMKAKHCLPHINRAHQHPGMTKPERQQEEALQVCTPRTSSGQKEKYCPELATLTQVRYRRVLNLKLVDHPCFLRELRSRVRMA